MIRIMKGPSFFSFYLSPAGETFTMESRNDTTNGTSTPSLGLSFSEVLIWCTAFSIVDAVVLIGNILTLIIFRRNKRLLRTRANYFLVNLAMADMMVGTVAIPLFVYHLAASISLGLKVWSIYSYNVYKVIDVFVGCSSFFTLTIISLERLCSVFWPHIHRQATDKLYYFLLGLVWILSVSVSALRLAHEHQQLSLNFFFYFMLVSFSAALFITCISYAMIGIKMKFRFQRKEMHKKSTEQDRRLAIMLFTVTILFVLTWLPFQIVNVVNFFCEPCRNMPRQVVYSTKFLHYGNSFVNPIIYSFLVPEFRKTLFKITRKFRI